MDGGRVRRLEAVREAESHRRFYRGLASRTGMICIAGKGSQGSRGVHARNLALVSLELLGSLAHDHLSDADVSR